MVSNGTILLDLSHHHPTIEFPKKSEFFICYTNSSHQNPKSSSIKVTFSLSFFPLLIHLVSWLHGFFPQLSLPDLVKYHSLNFCFSNFSPFDVYSISARPSLLDILDHHSLSCCLLHIIPHVPLAAAKTNLHCWHWCLCCAFINSNDILLALFSGPLFSWSSLAWLFPIVPSCRQSGLIMMIFLFSFFFFFFWGFRVLVCLLLLYLKEFSLIIISITSTSSLSWIFQSIVCNILELPCQLNFEDFTFYFLITVKSLFLANSQVL